MIVTRVFFRRIGVGVMNDRLGDGCRVVFPIRMYSKVRWLPASL